MRPNFMILTLALWPISYAQTYTIKHVAGGGVPNNVPALSASLNNVCGIAVDGLGNTYFGVPEYHAVMKRDTAGTLTRFAGNGTLGMTGDNGPAASAQLYSPCGVAVDAAGSVYIADQSNSRIRKVTNGIITTIAGTSFGFSGDGGPAVSAQLGLPAGVAVDSAGAVYIADMNNNRIRKVSNGIITTIAGSAVGGFLGDGGLATSARLSYPQAVVVDLAGNVIIADTNNGRVRRVTGGVIQTIAGTGSTTYNGDNILAVNAAINPYGIALDAVGNLYVTDRLNHRVRKITNGIITTVAGTGVAGEGGENIQATSSSLTFPRSVALDSAGNLYVASGSRLRRITGGIIATIAGNGNTSFGGDNGPATGSLLNTPLGLAVDGSGSVYIADSYNYRIRKVSNGNMTTVAGEGTWGDSGDNGPATSARLGWVHGIAVNTNGDLYIADFDYSRVRKVSNGVITTIAGTGTSGSSGDGGPAVNAQLRGPRGVAVDAQGSIYIADSSNHKIRKITGGVITTVAGTGAAGYSGDNGAATSAQLNLPNHVAVDASGNLYISDASNYVVRKVSGGIITTIAGNGTSGFSGDNGPATNAQLRFPTAVVVDSDGRVFIADRDNVRVRMVDNGIITTVAGVSPGYYSGDGGPAISAGLSQPWGMAMDAAGRIYVSNSSSHRVRVLIPGAVSSPCDTTISTSDLGVGAAGGTIKLKVSTGAGCPWSFSSAPSWMAVVGNPSGTGPAEITLQIWANPGQARTGMVGIAGVQVPIRQHDTSICSGTAACVTRALPHLAFGGPWTTGITAIGGPVQSGNFRVGFHNQTGAPVQLPIKTGAAPNYSAALSDSLAAQELKYFEIEDRQLVAQGAWGLVTADQGVEVHALFRRKGQNPEFYEASVPATAGYSAFVLPFDATVLAEANAQMYTGFAIVNLNPNSSARITCTARGAAGQVIPNAVTVPALSPLGHWADYLFPALAGQRGTLECRADTLVAALGLRFIGDRAYSSLPVIVK